MPWKSMKHLQQKQLRLYSTEHRRLLNSCVSPVDLLSFFIRIPCLILWRYQISMSFGLLWGTFYSRHPYPCRLDWSSLGTGSAFLVAFGLSLSTKKDTPWKKNNFCCKIVSSSPHISTTSSPEESISIHRCLAEVCVGRDILWWSGRKIFYCNIWQW